MDPCECADMFNTQLIIEQILNLINRQTECTDSYCFSPTDIENRLSDGIDPVASFSTLGVALMALLVLMFVLPMNVGPRRNGAKSKANAQKSGNKRNPNNDNHDNEPDFAM